jgi:plastocyanin
MTMTVSEPIKRKGRILVLAGSAIAATLLIATFVGTWWSPSTNASAVIYKGTLREFWLLNQDNPKIDEEKSGLPADVFNPTTIIVKKNDNVTIHFYNVEPDVDDRHSFTILENPYVMNVALDGGQSQTISFIANQTGVWTYICTFHQPSMRGQLVVEPPTLDELRIQRMAEHQQ